MVSDQLEAGGFGHSKSIRRSCDRYVMNAAHLVNLRVRVATQDDHSTLSLSHNVIARLGGMSGFEIEGPGVVKISHRNVWLKTLP